MDGIDSLIIGSGSGSGVAVTVSFCRSEKVLPWRFPRRTADSCRPSDVKQRNGLTSKKAVTGSEATGE